ncbi:hypothetical protein TBLA_0F01740 [Henningerozyma blattae CBS 6284]|uniref:Sphingolipid long chain base-responsive protein PIL1 n=1 Tax=Henningerozyma blattae (strain ATCC 34711 / CBS 6284 / DSM 70876 / NBRC 10599 / NRRL Y-10934 / UCD 77-7) TaxID=1071380 RepID=I2H5R4_HENB6|nr:hypothetical protein TBLA_0F01740 [Tetrapisispora blattae CBS 6284]CCH61716.1 hypothetical protein TBLA_0F01740 [Tetrapisispora blattae CBS 6284]
MHKTYSLREARAPTASQLINPPPPPSSTKSRFFGRGGVANTFRRNTAGAFGPELSRRLAQLVKVEKNILRSMEVAANERRDAATQLSLWGMENDDDVSDITDKLGVLIYEISDLDDQFIDRYDQYRLTLKSIRDIESSVQPSRDRSDRLTDKIHLLRYKDPLSPKIEILEQELVRAKAESLVAEAQLSNITRAKLRAAFNYQFDSIIEHSEKIALVAGYGKALLELLDDSPVTPGETRPAYDGYDASKQIIIDAETSLQEWTLDSAIVKPTLSIKQFAQSNPEEEEDEEEEGEEYEGEDNIEGELYLDSDSEEHQKGKIMEIDDEGRYIDYDDELEGGEEDEEEEMGIQDDYFDSDGNGRQCAEHHPAHNHSTNHSSHYKHHGQPVKDIGNKRYQNDHYGMHHRQPHHNQYEYIDEEIESDGEYEDVQEHWYPEDTLPHHPRMMVV